MRQHANRDGDRGDLIFEVGCAWCGQVRVSGNELAIRVGGGSDALFEFSCPECGRLNLRSLDRGDVGTLITAGVSPRAGRAPFELLEEHAGPPISWDDLIDFHLALNRRDRDRLSPAIDDGSALRGAAPPEEERDAA